MRNASSCKLKTPTNSIIKIAIDIMTVTVSKNLSKGFDCFQITRIIFWNPSEVMLFEQKIILVINLAN
jgi:hypothetical protein